MGKIYVEFVGRVAQIVGVKSMWIEVGSGRATLRDVMKKIGEKLGEDVVKAIDRMYRDEEIAIAINGVVVEDIDRELNDMDRVYMFPIAWGGRD